jgi:hypothetical protein
VPTCIMGEAAASAGSIDSTEYLMVAGVSRCEN